MHQSAKCVQLAPSVQSLVRSRPSAHLVHTVCKVKLVAPNVKLAFNVRKALKKYVLLARIAEQANQTVLSVLLVDFVMKEQQTQHSVCLASFVKQGRASQHGALLAHTQAHLSLGVMLALKENTVTLQDMYWFHQ